MQGIRPYKKQIEKHFQKLIQKYSLTFDNINDRYKNNHQIQLVGKECILEISKERYYDDMWTEFINPKDTSIRVSIITLMENDGFMNDGVLIKSMVTFEEDKFGKLIEDEVERHFYLYALAIERYFTYMFDGKYWD